MSPENVLEKVWKTVAEKDYEPFVITHHLSCSCKCVAIPLHFLISLWLHGFILMGLPVACIVFWQR